MATTASVKPATRTAKKPKPQQRRPRRQADPVLVDALRRQITVAQEAAAAVEANRDAVGLLTAGVLKLCATAYPEAIGAKLVIEASESKTVDLMLPIHRALIASAEEATTATPTPHELRARFRAWYARILEEVHAVETELGTKDSALAKALPGDMADDLKLKLNQVWHEMAFSMVLETPSELPDISPW